MANVKLDWKQCRTSTNSMSYYEAYFAGTKVYAGQVCYYSVDKKWWAACELEGFNPRKFETEKSARAAIVKAWTKFMRQRAFHQIDPKKPVLPASAKAPKKYKPDSPFDKKNTRSNKDWEFLHRLLSENVNPLELSVNPDEVYSEKAYKLFTEVSHTVLCSSTEVCTDFSVEGIIAAKTKVQNRSYPPNYFLLAKDDIPSFIEGVYDKGVYDPISEIYLLKAGYIGQLLGMKVFTDAFKPKPMLDRSYILNDYKI